MQGSSPKDLAKQFQKQDCVDFLASAENEAEIFEYGDSGDIILIATKPYDFVTNCLSSFVQVMSFQDILLPARAMYSY